MPAFPTFTAGESVHIPFGQITEYWNVINRQPHGYQYSYNILASGLKRWTIQFSLSDTDLATLQAFWVARKGRYEEFTFTDPDTATTTAKCRFDQDSLEVRYAGPNENIVSVTIQEYK
jgi:phage-related protein